MFLEKYIFHFLPMFSTRSVVHRKTILGEHPTRAKNEMRNASEEEFAFSITVAVSHPQNMVPIQKSSFSEENRIGCLFSFYIGQNCCQTCCRGMSGKLPEGNARHTRLLETSVTYDFVSIITKFTQLYSDNSV